MRCGLCAVVCGLCSLPLMAIQTPLPGLPPRISSGNCGKDAKDRNNELRRGGLALFSSSVRVVVCGCFTGLGVSFGISRESESWPMSVEYLLFGSG